MEPFDDQPFNGDTFLAEAVRRLVAQHGVRNIVETGTWHGVTTRFLAELVPCVHTVEAGAEALAAAREYWAGRPPTSRDPVGEIRAYLGSSVDWLPKILAEAERPTLYFLDAHGSGGCPLREEIALIAAADPAPVLVIHDAQNPEHPEFGYDSYDGPICYAWVREQLQKIRTPWEHWHNAAAAGRKIGVLFVAPRV